MQREGQGIVSVVIYLPCFAETEILVVKCNIKTTLVIQKPWFDSQDWPNQWFLIHYFQEYFSLQPVFEQQKMKRFTQHWRWISTTSGNLQPRAESRSKLLKYMPSHSTEFQTRWRGSRTTCTALVPTAWQKCNITRQIWRWNKIQTLGLINRIIKFIWLQNKCWNILLINTAVLVSLPCMWKN